MKRNFLVFVIFVISLLIISSFSMAFAASVVNGQKNPSVNVTKPAEDQTDKSAFTSKMFSSLKEAFDSDKEQFREIIGNPEKTAPVIPSQVSRLSQAGLDSIDYVHIGSEWYWTYHQIAIVDDDQNIIGESNGLTTHMHTSGDDAEAFIVGTLTSTCNGGTVSVTCSLGPHQPSATNILIFYVSNDGTNWNYEPQYIYVTWSSLAEYYAASFSQTFNYIGVCTWSPSTEYNSCLSVDSITVTTDGSPSSTVLTISTTEGGTTDPAPGGYYYYGETAEITAIPYENYVFDHWDIDFGNSQSTDPTIYISTWDSDHYVTAYFTYNPPPPGQQRLIIAATGGGTTEPSPGEYWYNYGSVASVSAQGSGFSYWLIDGQYTNTDSTISITMDGYHTVEAHFNEAPTHSLTINAIETYWGSSLDTPVYVDGNYVGNAPVTLLVSEGYHTIETPQYCGAFYLPWYSPTLWSSDGNVYYNGASVPVFTATTVTQCYDLGG